MSNKMDIVGVREQIKESATIIFPSAVGEYRSYCSSKYLPFNERDAFKVIMRNVFDEDEEDYKHQAILTCVVKGVTTIVAMGWNKAELWDAYLNLLDVLSISVTACLENASTTNKLTLLLGTGAWVSKNVQ